MSDMAEIRRLNEVIKERDARIAQLEQQLAECRRHSKCEPNDK